tara:strand:+ start:202 stop:699 length:498 start_codon:yes stop_codon:yes gene_type:complete
MNQDGVIILELNLIQNQYNEEMKYDGLFYYYNQNNYIFDNDEQRVIFNKGQIKTINKYNKQIIWEDAMPNSFTVFDLFNGLQDFIEINDFKILNNNNVKTFFNIKNWSVSGSIISQLETGEPKELEFILEKSIQTKVFILSAKVSADIILENLDTNNFDIVDLRE